MYNSININVLLLLYALGKYTKEELVQILKGIGFSQTVVNILVMKADHKKQQVNEGGEQCQDNLQACEEWRKSGLVA